MARLQEAARGTKWQDFLREYKCVLLSGVRHPAAWLFCAAWLASAIYLVTAGYGQTVLSTLLVCSLVLFCSLLTIAFTLHPPAQAQPDHAELEGQRWRMWVELAFLFVVILLTGYVGMIMNGAVKVSQASIPVITPAVVFLYRHLPIDVVNPLLYFVVPMAVLLALGVRWRDVGFARGYRSWSVTVIWSVVPVVLIVVALIDGQRSIELLGALLLQNALRNGFFEEFLFRGALMSRFALVCGYSWAIVLSSLLFGLWHIGVNTSDLGGNFLAGAADGILSQATIGLGFAIVVYRTRNLLASSIIHVLFNVGLG